MNHSLSGAPFATLLAAEFFISRGADTVATGAYISMLATQRSVIRARTCLVLKRAGLEAVKGVMKEADWQPASQRLFWPHMIL